MQVAGIDKKNPSAMESQMKTVESVMQGLTTDIAGTFPYRLWAVFSDCHEYFRLASKRPRRFEELSTKALLSRISPKLLAWQCELPLVNMVERYGGEHSAV
jgi:hypothetical protein